LWRKIEKRRPRRENMPPYDDDHHFFVFIFKRFDHSSSEQTWRAE